MGPTSGTEIKKHHKVPWLAVILGLGAIASLIAWTGSSTFKVTSTSPVIPQGIQINTGGSVAGYAQMESVSNSSYAARAPSADMAYAPYPGTRYGGKVDITDTREFNKVNYDAQMRSRDVQGLTKRVETTVRGYDGRVDNTSSSPKHGYVSFVVPVSKFDSFRDELENLVGQRYLSIKIQSQNLLPQKQGIEASQTAAQDSLDELNARKDQITSDHKNALKSLQSQLDSDTAQVNKLQAQVTYDPQAESQRLAAIEVLTQNQAALRTRIANENSSYQNQLASINNQISWAQGSLDSANTQDQNLTNDVATVNGSVSIEWISIWEIVHLYLPGLWVPGILAALAVLAYAWHHWREKRMGHALT